MFFRISNIKFSIPTECNEKNENESNDDLLVVRQVIVTF